MLENLRRNLRKFYSLITVEPCVAIFMIAVNLTTLANVNLLLDKACRVNLAYDPDLCDSLIRRNLTTAEQSDADIEVQKFVANLNSVGKSFMIVIPFVLVLLWGTWSDRNCLRKPLIIMPIIGEIFKNICLMLCVLFKDSNTEVAFLVENLFPLAFGTWTVILLGVYSHVMDTTTVENRTVKVACSSIFVTIGDPLGAALSGVLLNKFGYYSVFGTSVVLMFIAMMYCIFRVKECDQENVIGTTMGLHDPKKRIQGFRLFVDFLRVTELRGIFQVMFRKRTDRKRMMLWFGYSLVIFGLGPNLGHFAVQYLYARHQFNVTEIEYSLFGTINSVSGTIAVGTIILLNSKLFRMNNYGLSILGLCFGIASSLVFAFSHTWRDFFIAGVVDSGFGSFIVAMRAALMNQVEPEETAKSNAIIGATEGMLYLAFGSLYNFIYGATVETFAGAFYFITTGCWTYSMIVSVILLFIYRSNAMGQFRLSTETIVSQVEKY